MKELKIIFSRWFAVYLAVLLLIVPIKLLFCMVLSAFVHELFHLVALRIMKIKIYSIEIQILGSKIISMPMDKGKELICALAGPFGGLVLACICKNYPLIVVCSMLHTIFNLIPIYPLDGGRVFRCIMCAIFPLIMGEQVSDAISLLFKGLLLLLAVLFCIKQGVFTILPILAFCIIKIPCKHRAERVQ